MIDLDRLLSAEAVTKLRNNGLHKVASALHQVESGEAIGDMTLEKAAAIIAQKAFLKRASYREISKGLAAYYNLTKSADAVTAAGSAPTPNPVASSLKSAFGGGGGGGGSGMSMPKLPSMGPSLGKTITGGLNKLIGR